MAIRALRNADEAKNIIDLMTDHTYEVRSALNWLVDKISELEKRIVKLEKERD